NLESVDPGFRVANLIAFSINPWLSGYDRNGALSLYERLQQELSAVPGVESVSMSELGALSGNEWGITMKVDGYEPKEGENMNISVDGVGPRYFATMGIPLVAGREFTNQDSKGAAKVAIVNETMAKYFFGNESAIGRRLAIGRSSPADIEIVGVAK